MSNTWNLCRVLSPCRASSTRNDQDPTTSKKSIIWNAPSDFEITETCRVFVATRPSLWQVWCEKLEVPQGRAIAPMTVTFHICGTAWKSPYEYKQVCCRETVDGISTRGSPKCKERQGEIWIMQASNEDIRVRFRGHTLLLVER